MFCLILQSIEEMRKALGNRNYNAKLKIDKHKPTVTNSGSSNQTFPRIKEEKEIKTEIQNDLKQSQQQMDRETFKIKVNFNENDESKEKENKQRQQTIEKNRRFQIRSKKCLSAYKTAENKFIKDQEQHLVKGAPKNGNLGEEEKIEEILKCLKRAETLSDRGKEYYAITKKGLHSLIKYLLYLKVKCKTQIKHNRDSQSNQKLVIQELEEILKEEKIISNIKQEFSIASLPNRDNCDFTELKLQPPKQDYQNVYLKASSAESQHIQDVQDHIFNKVIKKNVNLFLSDDQDQNSNDFQASNTSIFIETFGRQYKNIEADLHEYSIELQSKGLQVQVKYEMTPFLQIQNMIDEELRTVSKLVNHDHELSPTLKVDLIRNFLHRSVQKFKARDGQVRELLEFKTQCILQFIQKMKSWYHGWAFKNEYLETLKSQFTLTSAEIKKKLNLLIDKYPFKKMEDGDQLISYLKELQKMNQQVFKNYQLGNIFY